MTKNLQTAHKIGNRHCDKGQREDMIIYTHRDTLRGNRGNRKCLGSKTQQKTIKTTRQAMSNYTKHRRHTAIYKM